MAHLKHEETDSYLKAKLLKYTVRFSSMRNWNKTYFNQFQSYFRGEKTQNNINTEKYEKW